MQIRQGLRAGLWADRIPKPITALSKDGNTNPDLLASRGEPVPLLELRQLPDASGTARTGGTLSISQPIGDELAPMPLRRKHGAQGFQQQRQRLRESIGRVDDVKTGAIVKAGLIIVVQPVFDT